VIIIPGDTGWTALPQEVSVSFTPGFSQVVEIANQPETV